MLKKVAAFIWLFVAACASAQRCGTLSAGDHSFTVMHDGLQREYLLHVPRGYVSGSVGLVVAWHGLTDNPANFAELTRYSELSDEYQSFIVAYPAGVGASWNAGSCCSPATTRDIDDFGFARTLVQDISERICIDSKKVFTTGFSNGCFMSQGLICKAPDVFVASGCGSGGEILLTDCDADFNKFNTSIDILEIHGTADLIVPYDGSRALGFPAVEDNYAEHRTRLECKTGPTETYSKGNFRCERYSDCRLGAKVEQCTVTRGTHSWFDGADFSNSEYILDFFGL